MGRDESISEHLLHLSMLMRKANLLHHRYSASLYLIFAPKEDHRAVRVMFTGEEVMSNPAYAYHCLLYNHEGSKHMFQP
jgi:hypothetical protein